MRLIPVEVATRCTGHSRYCFVTGGLGRRTDLCTDGPLYGRTSACAAALQWELEQPQRGCPLQYMQYMSFGHASPCLAVESVQPRKKRFWVACVACTDRFAGDEHQRHGILACAMMC